MPYGPPPFEIITPQAYQMIAECMAKQEMGYSLPSDIPHVLRKEAEKRGVSEDQARRIWELEVVNWRLELRQRPRITWDYTEVIFVFVKDSLKGNEKVHFVMRTRRKNPFFSQVEIDRDLALLKRLQKQKKTTKKQKSLAPKKDKVKRLRAQLEGAASQKEKRALRRKLRRLGHKGGLGS